MSTAQLCFNKRIPHLCTLEVGQRMYQSRFKVMSRSNRSSLQSTIHTLCIRILGTNSIKLETKTEEIGYAIFTVQVYGKLIELFRFNGTFFHDVTQTQIKLTLIRCTRNAHIVIGQKTCLEYLILPISINSPLSIIIRVASLRYQLLVVQPLHRTHGLSGGQPGI